MKLTFGLGCFVIGFADQFSILHKVKFVAGIELSGANHAGETLQMINEILSSSNDLSRRDAQVTAGALRAKPPGAKSTKTPLQQLSLFDISHILTT